ncbi:hypothetical protein TSOC_009132 [Tetrabaena socialis]|uniref:Uncharacterized protein n=1 Tax=Tetrabaena socialis TaxID=47790 RepID=A0A2J7ZWP7_9CHLO|nr:hypothetical protein TSOC_009132 [Tetrabaena socialis]|eukprot:PNH04686.1 hypothetical protein TSOC_009132 [Tetrabaena socialis]
MRSLETRLRKAVGRWATKAGEATAAKVAGDALLRASLQEWKRSGGPDIAAARRMLAGEPPPVGPKCSASRSACKGDVLLNMARAIVSGRLPLQSVQLGFMADVCSNLLYASTCSFRWSRPTLLLLGAAWASGGAKSALRVLYGHVLPQNSGSVPRAVAELVSGRCFNLLGPSEPTIKETVDGYGNEQVQGQVGATAAMRKNVGFLQRGVTAAKEAVTSGGVQWTPSPPAAAAAAPAPAPAATLLPLPGADALAGPSGSLLSALLLLDGAPASGLDKGPVGATAAAVVPAVEVVGPAAAAAVVPAAAAAVVPAAAAAVVPAAAAAVVPAAAEAVVPAAAEAVVPAAAEVAAEGACLPGSRLCEPLRVLPPSVADLASVLRAHPIAATLQARSKGVAALEQARESLLKAAAGPQDASGGRRSKVVDLLQRLHAFLEQQLEPDRGVENRAAFDAWLLQSQLLLQTPDLLVEAAAACGLTPSDVGEADAGLVLSEWAAGDSGLSDAALPYSYYTRPLQVARCLAQGLQMVAGPLPPTVLAVLGRAFSGVYRLGFDATDITASLTVSQRSVFVGDSLLQAAFPGVAFEDGYNADALNDTFRQLVGPALALAALLQRNGISAAVSVAAQLEVLRAAASYVTKVTPGLEQKRIELSELYGTRRELYVKKSSSSGARNELFVNQIVELERLSARVALADAALQAAAEVAASFGELQQQSGTVASREDVLAAMALVKAAREAAATIGAATAHAAAACASARAAEASTAAAAAGSAEAVAEEAAEVVAAQVETAAQAQADMVAAATAAEFRRFGKAMAEALSPAQQVSVTAAARAAAAAEAAAPLTSAAAAALGCSGSTEQMRNRRDVGVDSVLDTAVDYDTASALIGEGETVSYSEQQAPCLVESMGAGEEEADAGFADEEGSGGSTCNSCMQQLAAEAALLVARALKALERVFNCQRVAATKLLLFRLSSLRGCASIAVARVPCGTLSSAGMHALVQEVGERVQQRLRGSGAVAMWSYDGESTGLRAGDDPNRPTTIRQLGQTCVTCLKDGGTASVYGQVRAAAGVAPRGKIAAAKLRAFREGLAHAALSRLHPAPRIAAPLLCLAGIAPEAPPRPGASLEAAQDYMRGPLRPGQLVWLMQQVEAGRPLASSGNVAGAEVGARAGAARTAGGRGQGQRCGGGSSGGGSGAYGGDGGNSSVGGGTAAAAKPPPPTLRPTPPGSFEERTASIYPSDAPAWMSFATAQIFAGVVPTTAQALLAYRLVWASQDAEVLPQSLGEVLLCAGFNAARMRLLQLGCNLVDNVYQATTSPTTGKPRLDHEDYMHKLTCFVSQLRAQQPSDSSSWPLLLSLRNILAVSAGCPELAHITAALAKSADAQSVPLVEALVYDTNLQVRLVAAGHAEDALVLRLLGEEYQAWDMPHLTCPVRVQRMQALHALLRQLVLPQLNDPRQAAKFVNRSNKVWGITTDLLSVLMSNSEAHSQLLAAMPSASRLLVQTSTSTDDCENEFGTLVNGCGYKPTVEMAAGFLAHTDFLAHLRRNYPEHGIVVPSSSKSRYTHHHATQLRDSQWSDGLWVMEAADLGGCTGCGAGGTTSSGGSSEPPPPAGGFGYSQFVAGKIARSCNVLGLRRDRSIRSFHSMRTK